MSGYHDEPAWEDDPYPELRAVLAPAYSDLPAWDIETVFEAAGLSAEEMEFSLDKAFQSVGQFVKSAAPAILPVAGTVLGTAFGGPVGAALGGTLGRAAGGAVASAPAPTGSPPLPSGAPAPGGSPAAAQLLQVLGRPELLQALLAIALGSAGRAQVPVAGTPVPAAAFPNLVGALAKEAQAEHHVLASEDEEAVPAYLLDASGAAAVDVAVPEQRAGRLLELLHEAAREEWPVGGGSEVEALFDDLELAELVYERAAS